MEGSLKRLAAVPVTGSRAHRRQQVALKTQLRRYGEELQRLTTEAKELYEQLKPLLGLASQQYVEHVITRLVAAAEGAQQGR